jgi:putative addiction module component (TIGR02574 family)
MNKALRDQVLNLPPEERAELAQEIWDSLSPSIGLTAAQIAEAERRFQACKEDPTRAKPWKEMMDRLQARFR